MIVKSKIASAFYHQEDYSEAFAELNDLLKAEELHLFTGTQAGNLALAMGNVNLAWEILVRLNNEFEEVIKDRVKLVWIIDLDGEQINLYHSGVIILSSGLIDFYLNPDLEITSVAQDTNYELQISFNAPKIMINSIKFLKNKPKYYVTILTHLAIVATNHSIRRFICDQENENLLKTWVNEWKRQVKIGRKEKGDMEEVLEVLYETVQYDFFNPSSID